MYIHVCTYLRDVCNCTCLVIYSYPYFLQFLKGQNAVCEFAAQQTLTLEELSAFATRMFDGQVQAVASQQSALKKLEEDCTEQDSLLLEELSSFISGRLRSHQEMRAAKIASVSYIRTYLTCSLNAEIATLTCYQ